MAHPPITVTILGSGTSSGIPMIACDCKVCRSTNSKDKRLRSSIMVETSTTRIVIDTTPDFRTQMLNEKVKTLDAAVFTHSHKDHVAGLDDIRAFNYFQKKPIDIFATEATQAALKKEFSYVFADYKYPGIPDLILHTIQEDEFTIGDISITPISVLHLNMPVLGFRIADFVYITDANYISPAEKEKLIGAKVILLNALRREKHISHFTLEEACALADECNIEQAYFTHISHQLGLHDAVNASLPPNKQLGFDGMTIQL
jgi:phosphoribosyl 1,2-cyclic phosphate phosphodiesterase